MRILLLSLIIGSLFSCSPQKSLNRLIKNHPELVQRDTVWKQDTVIVSGTSKDTIFQSVITKDTVTIVRDQLTMKYYSDGKTVYLKGTCDTVKIIREIPIMVNSVNPINEVHVIKWYDYTSYAIAVLAILFIIITRLIPRRNS